MRRPQAARRGGEAAARGQRGERVAPPRPDHAAYKLLGNPGEQSAPAVVPPPVTTADTDIPSPDARPLTVVVVTVVVVKQLFELV